MVEEKFGQLKPNETVLHIKPSTIAMELGLPVQVVSHNMRFLEDYSDMVATPVKAGAIICQYEIKMKSEAAA